ncbi:MAG: hypothetical protein LBS14_04080 [Holosporaceae bacterium]|jgi:hypothetical protein|nr:hypothetical protein [Holosporaceae bacterium]
MKKCIMIAVIMQLTPGIADCMWRDRGGQVYGVGPDGGLCTLEFVSVLESKV